MNKFSKVIVATLMWFFSVAHADQNTLVESLKQARSCKVSTRFETNQIDCDYKLTNFHLSIAGVGQDDAGIGFMNSNFDDLFWGSVGKLHGCVIIKAGRSHPGRLKHEHVKPAFISPVNGVVYDDWQLCSKAERK